MLTLTEYQALDNALETLSTLMAHFGPMMGDEDRRNRENTLQKAQAAMSFIVTK